MFAVRRTPPFTLDVVWIDDRLVRSGVRGAEEGITTVRVKAKIRVLTKKRAAFFSDAGRLTLGGGAEAAVVAADEPSDRRSSEPESESVEHRAELEASLESLRGNSAIVGSAGWRMVRIGRSTSRPMVVNWFTTARWATSSGRVLFSSRCAENDFVRLRVCVTRGFVGRAREWCESSDVERDGEGRSLSRRDSLEVLRASESASCRASMSRFSLVRARLGAGRDDDVEERSDAR